ncbi:hypothetical protein D9M68_819300 [compost metagenome]
MAKTTSELITLAGTGANIVIDAATKTTTEIINIVGVVGRKNGNITIKNCNKKTTIDLLTICRVYPNSITLDFTER